MGTGHESETGILGKTWGRSKGWMRDGNRPIYIYTIW